MTIVSFFEYCFILKILTNFLLSSEKTPLILFKKLHKFIKNKNKIEKRKRVLYIDESRPLQQLSHLGRWEVIAKNWLLLWGPFNNRNQTTEPIGASPKSYVKQPGHIQNKAP